MVSNRAVTFINKDTPCVISTTELDLDTCYNPNEIVIKIHAAALNPVDVLLYKFAYSFLVGSGKKVYGRDYSGVIVKAGADVKDYAVGDRVNGMFDKLYGEKGTLCDHLILDPKKSIAITKMSDFPKTDKPKTLETNDFIRNAAWPLVFGTAYSLLYNFNQKFTEDSVILVIGASTSVGNAIIQMAKHELKIGTVIGVCSSKSFPFNEKAGFDYLVAYDDPSKPVVETVQGYLKNELKGKKLDLIADCVGNNQFFPVIYDILKPKSENSQYLTIIGDKKGNYQNPTVCGMISLGGIIRRLNPFRGYNYTSVMLKPQTEYMKLGAKMVKNGTYMPIIDSVYEFDQFQQGIDRLTSNRTKGKVVININE